MARQAARPNIENAEIESE